MSCCAIHMGDRMSVSYHISCKNKNGEYQLYEVPYDIRMYILQLEAYITNPKESKLLEFYSDRFGGLKRVEE